jgi:hypothetical protein
VNPDLLIPPDSELAQLLLQWSESTDERTWNIANLTNELIEEIEGETISRSDIYKAVATRCKGKKPNTIRRWAECAADFDQETQEKYAQLLSFDHFKTARRLFKDGHTPYLEYALEWCIEGNDHKLSAGRFHTVGQMLEQFLPADTFEGRLSKAWNAQKERLYDLMLIHDNDGERMTLLTSWQVIDTIVSRLDKVAEV